MQAPWNITVLYCIKYAYCQNKSQYKFDFRQVLEMETKKEAIDLSIHMHGLSVGDETVMLTHANLYLS